MKLAIFYTFLKIFKELIGRYCNAHSWKPKGSWWDNRMFVVKVYYKIGNSLWALITLTKPVPEGFELHASDWAEKLATSLFSQNVNERGFATWIVVVKTDLWKQTSRTWRFTKSLPSFRFTLRINSQRYSFNSLALMSSAFLCSCFYLRNSMSTFTSLIILTLAFLFRCLII